MDIDAIKDFKAEFKNIWWQSSSDFPAFDTVFVSSRQSVMEAEMGSFINKTVDEVKKFPTGMKGDSPEWGARLRHNIHKAGIKALGFEKSNMDMLLNKGFCSSTYEFMENSRRFDDSIKIDDIMQAMRNVWIMNCIQLMLDREVEYTQPLFAYSMLYPYTDNYLDEPGISMEEKARTGERLRLRLQGESVDSINTYEGRLFKLVEMIEGYYPREVNPIVFESLVWINDAQMNSLFQQKTSVSPYEKDLLDLSFQKGGTSVLADAYLVKGSLTPEEARFMFGFGIVLQLGDDLQDTLTDGKNGHMTIFSQTAGKWDLDGITNKLFNFTASVIDSGSCLKAPAMKELSLIMKRSCNLLLLGAIANNKGLFSKSYQKSIEAYSPLSFKYVRSMMDRVGKEYRNLRIKSAGRPVEIYMAKALAKGAGA